MTDFKLGQTQATRMAALATVLVLAGAVQAQAGPKPQYPIRKPAAESQAAKPEKQVIPPVSSTTPENAEPNEGGWTEVRKKSVDIGTQPVRDVGIMKRQIPPILVKAQNDPYSLKGLKTCKQLSSELTSLNEVLGADYVVGNEVKENRAGKLAEAGGKTVINSIIPFRSLVREVTGAAPADRRLNAALDAGYARRGFLRGVHARQGCKTTF
ncbi:hypothetical protein ASD38_07205 [Caulobacter sp. Root487D2Y]|uniref:hypothetical protein n=1 Tax=Caulobacter sp. Root487D2Y TaxID=1736547 RepID=UPI0006FE1EA8|nr:hypothetical protein [Caulobacter sp. Root487D2Y]KQY31126.1 hypothetical protein ASD38_07205 [Caulobacter sp. Root487D2Y]